MIMDPKVCPPHYLAGDTKEAMELRHYMLIVEAVAYQFAKIGNGVAGQALVGLSDDEFLGNYIDYMGMSSGYGSHQLFVQVLTI